MATIVIDSMSPRDWPAVREIFREGIATGNATLETQVPEWDVWDARHRKDCRLVARVGDQVIGWTALVPYSNRSVYAGVAEVVLYVAESGWGQGIGKLLLRAMIDTSEKAGIWTLQAIVLPENIASIMVLRVCGFREVGRREKIGRVNGIWRDILLLERRSKVVGV